MRTATPETRRALMSALKGWPSHRAWETANELSHGTVNDCLRGKPMRAKRENKVRAVLNLPPITWERIEIEPEHQKIVKRQKARWYVTRQLRLTPEAAAALDAEVAEAGCRSLNEYYHAGHPLQSPGMGAEFSPH